MENKVIRQYVKRGNKRVGLVVAWHDKVRDSLCIGYSLCNKKDKFDKEYAFAIAMMRSLYPIQEEEVPRSVYSTVYVVVNRAVKYFKVSRYRNNLYQHKGEVTHAHLRRTI